MLVIEFCGEELAVHEGSSLTIGREGDLVIDENPYLHRRFLHITHHSGFWWISNVGSQISATLSERAGIVEAWLSPGASIPVVFEACVVRFTAGPSAYEVGIRLSDAPFAPLPGETATEGTTTYGRTSLTPEQHLLLVALAEQELGRRHGGSTRVASSAQIADRLGWTITKFNRKLDNLCQKLERLGVKGLHGGPGRLASDRRARLAEYALAMGLVVPQDVDLLGTTNPGTTN